MGWKGKGRTEDTDEGFVGFALSRELGDGSGPLHWDGFEDADFHQGERCGDCVGLRGVSGVLSDEIMVKSPYIDNMVHDSIEGILDLRDHGLGLQYERLRLVLLILGICACCHDFGELGELVCQRSDLFG